MININHSSTFGTASHKHITSLSNSTPSMGPTPTNLFKRNLFFPMFTILLDTRGHFKEQNNCSLRLELTQICVSCPVLHLKQFLTLYNANLLFIPWNELVNKLHPSAFSFSCSLITVNPFKIKPIISANHNARFHLLRWGDLSGLSWCWRTVHGACGIFMEVLKG